MFPVFPAFAQPGILRIWQEAHVMVHREHNYVASHMQEI